MSRKRYTNLDQVENKKTFKDLLAWKKERKNKTKDLSVLIPHTKDKKIPYLRENKEETTITWIGHATFLIQMNGLNILTDPVWASKMGFQSRLTKPGIEIEDLPKIDAVVISHGHYDHLDVPTLYRLKGDPIIFVPVGLKKLLIKKGFKRTEEFHWWDKKRINRLEFTFVPAQHWTRRGLFDMNTSHWGGWIINQNEKNLSIYFVGDTGYFQGFQQIGEAFDIDYVLMPIGAYEPEWFMRVSHINPEDAVRAFQELQGKYFIPMHYGTYHLADDTGPEALERLEKAWNNNKLDQEKLLILKLGETIEIPK